MSGGTGVVTGASAGVVMGVGGTTGAVSGSRIGSIVTFRVRICCRFLRRIVPLSVLTL